MDLETIAHNDPTTAAYLDPDARPTWPAPQRHSAGAYTTNTSNKLAGFVRSTSAAMRVHGGYLEFRPRAAGGQHKHMGSPEAHVLAHLLLPMPPVPGLIGVGKEGLEEGRQDGQGEEGGRGLYTVRATRTGSTTSVEGQEGGQGDESSSSSTPLIKCWVSSPYDAAVAAGLEAPHKAAVDPSPATHKPRAAGPTPSINKPGAGAIPSTHTPGAEDPIPSTHTPGAGTIKPEAGPSPAAAEGDQGVKRLEEALSLHQEMQKRLREQLEAQRQLQMSLAAHGRYITSLMEQMGLSQRASTAPQLSFSPPTTP